MALTVSIIALAQGCAIEMQELHRGLRAGYFACAVDGDGDPLFSQAYAASHRLHGLPSKSIRKRAQRWWFTGYEGRSWPGEAEDPEAVQAIRALDSQFAKVAAVLAGAAFLSLGLRRPTVLGGAAMLRGLRYAGSEPSDPERAGIPAHVDFGDFTLCHSNRPGLEVWDEEAEEWSALLPGRLYFIAAAGLESKSKGKVKAVKHRVSQSNHERFSFCRLHGVPAAQLKGR